MRPVLTRLLVLVVNVGLYESASEAAKEVLRGL